MRRRSGVCTLSMTYCIISSRWGYLSLSLCRLMKAHPTSSIRSIFTACPIGSQTSRLTVQTGAERDRLYQNYGAAIARFHQALASYKDDDILNRTWQTDFQTRVFDEAIPIIFANLDPVRLSSFKASLAEIEPNMSSRLCQFAQTTHHLGLSSRQCRRRWV